LQFSKRIQKSVAMEANSNARIEQHSAAAYAMMRRTTQAAAPPVTNAKSD
jgi:hypothetical protein